MGSGTIKLQDSKSRILSKLSTNDYLICNLASSRRLLSSSPGLIFAHPIAMCKKLRGFIVAHPILDKILRGLNTAHHNFCLFLPTIRIHLILEIFFAEKPTFQKTGV